MSNGLHHVAPASFFPTAKELSSGLQWFKEHPILAAAAATAVSVITYLHTAEDDDVDANAADAAALAELLAADAADDPAVAGAAAHIHKASSAPSAPPPRPPRRRASSPSMTSTLDASVRASPSPRRASTPTTGPNGRVTPPALRKPGSEGKMSPAAVTWVDEHGGSLTQVFEHLTIDHDDDDEDHDNGRAYPDLDGPQGGPGGVFKASLRPQCRPPTPRRTTTKAADEEVDSDVADATTSSNSSGHWMGPIGIPSPQLPAGNATPPAGAGDRPPESPSPQWGWYVPITPPQDHLTGGATSSLPRAGAVPPPSSSSVATRTAAALAVASVVDDSASSSSAMRRSASGRIKAA